MFNFLSFLFAHAMSLNWTGSVPTYRTRQSSTKGLGEVRYDVLANGRRPYVSPSKVAWPTLKRSDRRALERAIRKHQAQLEA